MKKLIFVFTFILILPLTYYSQWIQQDVATTNTILDIQFVNEDVGYCSDDSGNIYKTINKGLNWTTIKSTSSNYFFNSISFVNENYGWVIDRNEGFLMNTTDGGDSWTSSLSIVAYNSNDIQFINEQIGWTVGVDGKIYNTTDGGTSWNKQSSNSLADLWSVYFIDENIGYVTGSGVILKTIDGGANWFESYITSESKKIEAFKSIYFTGFQYGWAVGEDWENGDGSIIHTNDGGITWSFQNSGVNGFRLQSVHFVDDSVGFACGGEGTILSTIDAGANWYIEETGTTEFFRDIYAVDSSSVYAVGVNGTILSNSYFLDLTIDWDYNKVNFEVGSHQTVRWQSQQVDEVKIEYSIDAGKNWITIRDNYPAQYGSFGWNIPNTPSIYCKFKITDVAASSATDTIPRSYYSHYWNKDFNDEYYFTIYGNNQWVTVTTPGGDLSGIKFIDDLHGFAWGDDILLQTNDGGNNWTINTDNKEFNPSFINLNIGWKIENTIDTSYVLKTKDGGANWEAILSHSVKSEVEEFGHSSFRYTVVTFGSESNGMVSADSYQWYGGMRPFSEVYNTNDGGKEWERITEYISYHADGGTVTSIDHTDKNSGWWNVVRTDEYALTTNTFHGLANDNRTGYQSNQFSSATYSPWLLDDGSAWLIDNELIFVDDGFSSSYEDGRRSVLNKYTTAERRWESIYKTIDKKNTSIYFVNSSVGWCSGNQYYFDTSSKTETNKYDFICMTTDGGGTWELQQFGAGAHSFSSIDSKLCWAISDGKIIRYGNISKSTPDIWFRSLQITENNNQAIMLDFGQSSYATSSIDDGLGESELPPPPPTGSFDARFILDNNSSTKLDLRNSEDQGIIWTLQFQPSSSGYPINFSWNKENLPFGSYYLRDAINGTIVNVDMKLEDSYNLTNESISKLQIVYKEQFTSGVANNSDWNLLSVPLNSDNMEVTSIFPDATSPAFSFDGSYVSNSTLDNSVGYWVKFPEVGLRNVYGAEVNNLISVKLGWNLIGPYNQEINSDQITTTPNGIIAGDIYGFDNGYFIADILEVGKGYWVKANQDGEINFTNTSALSKKNNSIDISEDPTFNFNITLDDGISDSISLTFGLASLATDGYDPLLGEEELPPLPPLGVFDVRIELPDTLITTYSDIRLLAVDCYEHIINYQLGDSSEGLTLSWDLPEGVTLNIIDLFGGSVFDESFGSGEDSFSITNTNINNVKLTFCYSDVVLSQNEVNLIPIEYSLLQNYPNPFNPSTKIKFGLPEESKVSLIIYNILGEQVSQLVNQQLKAGYHEIEFINTIHSSGIYFYRLQADDFVETKKMILMK